MNIKVMEHIIGFAKNIGAAGNKLMDAADPEKYVAGVKALGQSVDETYAKMRDLITEDESLSISEKLERLDKLAQSQAAAQLACEKSIKENREHIARVIAEVFAALITCGIACIPKAIKKRKKSIAIVSDTTEYSELPPDETGELNPSIIEEGVTQ